MKKMKNQPSVIRAVIEDIWNTDSLNQAKIKLIELMSNVKMISEMQKRRLLLDIGNCQSKEKLDQIATNCMLKFEGHGVIA